jgi:hypothetical protein
MGPKVIEAAAAFRCRHQYAAVTPRSSFMFVCLRCGHRAECLQLTQREVPTRVLAFPKSAVARRPSANRRRYNRGARRTPL